MRFSYDNLRPMLPEDFMPFSGATPAPGAPKGYDPTGTTEILLAKFGPWIGTVWIEDDQGPTCWTVILGGVERDETLWAIGLIPMPQVQERLKLTELQLEVRGGYEQKDRMTQICYLLQSFNETGNSATVETLQVLGFHRI